MTLLLIALAVVSLVPFAGVVSRLWLRVAALGCFGFALLARDIQVPLLICGIIFLALAVLTRKAMLRLWS